MGRLDANGGRFRGASCHGLSQRRAQLQVEVQQNIKYVSHIFQLQLQHVTCACTLSKMLNSPSQLSSLPSFSAQLKITRACAYSTQYSCATLTTHLMRTFRRPGRGAKRRGRAGHKHKARKGVIDIFHVGARRPAPASRARPPPTDRVRALERDSAATAWGPTYTGMLLPFLSGKKRSKKKATVTQASQVVPHPSTD